MIEQVVLHDREEKEKSIAGVQLYPVGTGRMAVSNNNIENHRDYLPTSLSQWDKTVYYNYRTPPQPPT